MFAVLEGAAVAVAALDPNPLLEPVHLDLEPGAFFFAGLSGAGLGFAL